METAKSPVQTALATGVTIAHRVMAAVEKALWYVYTAMGPAT